MKRCLIFFATTLICSCQPALVNIPPLPDCPRQPAAEPVQCPALAMPDPIPQKFKIIRDGDAIEADQAGKDFLWRYKELRKQIKDKWHS